MAIVFDGVLDGAPHQPLGAKGRDGLDSDRGIGANLLRPSAQHVLIEEVDQLFHLGRARFPLDANVNVFGIFAVDHHVQALGMAHRGRNAGKIAHGPHTGVEIENLPQRNVQRTYAAAHWSSERPLDGHAEVARCFHGLLREPLLKFVVGFFAGEHLEPHHTALAAVSMVDGGVEDALRSLPDVASGAVAFDVRNNRPVGDAELAAGKLNGLAIVRHGQRVVRRFHELHLVSVGPRLRRTVFAPLLLRPSHPRPEKPSRQAKNYNIRTAPTHTR